MEILKTIISILAIAIVLIFTGCGAKTTTTNRTEYLIEPGHRPVVLVKIDGCEYLYGPWGSATVLAHKGNCLNHGPKPEDRINNQ